MHRTVLVVVALRATVAFADDPKPPSTGKELAHDTAPATADIQAEIARRLIAGNSCEGRVERMSTALSLAADKLAAAERIAGNVLLQDCARNAHAYHATIQAATYLLVHAPAKTNAEYLTNAVLSLGDAAKAEKLAGLLAKQFPSQTANLAAARSMITCHNFDFARCFDASGKMIEFLARTKTGTAANVSDNRIFHMSSAGALGNWGAFETDMRWMESHAKETHESPQLLQAIAAVFAQTKAVKLFVQESAAPELAIGTYHLIAGGKIKRGDDDAALVTLRMLNQSGKPRAVKVTVEVPGVTEQMTQVVPLPAGTQWNQPMSPPLKIDFDVTKLRATRTGQIVVHIVDAATSAAIYDRTMPVDILPRDNLPLFRKIGGDDIRDTFEYTAAWITPNEPSIDAFIKKAKARLGGDDSFSGEQQGTVAQVKALFDELKAHGVSYVSDPDLFNDHGAVQRTRLPAEVLASTNAQCLEGTLLYATLLEAIGLQPVMVFVPGHVFIAWKPSRYDKTDRQLLFLETTMTGGAATFEQASRVAAHEFDEQVAEKRFELGLAHVVDVTALRRAGYTPQPW
jgi:hypothetical protein